MSVKGLDSVGLATGVEPKIFMAIDVGYLILQNYLLNVFTSMMFFTNTDSQCLNCTRMQIPHIQTYCSLFVLCAQ